MSKPNKNFPFTMGADPEFSILFSDNKVAADSLLTNLGKKMKLVDKNMGYEVGKNGNFGWDGHSVTAELRPAPSHNPIEVADNIGTLLKTICKNAPYLQMSVKNNYGMVGGHIHLSLPKTIQKKLISDHDLADIAPGQTIPKTQVTARIHRLLVYYCLPIFMAENQLNATIRRRSSYGHLDDYRLQKISDQVLYEFRPLAAEWILTPKLAQAVLAYVGVVYNEIINNPKIDKEQPAIVNIKQLPALASILDYNLSFLLEPCIDKIAKQVRSFAAYGDWKDEINYILNVAKVKQDKAKLDFSVTRGWRLTQTKKQEVTLDALLNQRAINKFKEQFDVEPLLPMAKLAYNDDLNVAQIAQDIKTRMICHQWTPKIPFALFGVRKGINDFIIGYNENDYRPVTIPTLVDLKTRKDWEACVNTLDKVRRKLQRDNQRQLLVGIPYHLRINNIQLAPIIAKLWELDQLDEIKVHNARDLASTGKGKFQAVDTSLETAVVDNLVNEELENCTNQAQRFTQEITNNIAADSTTCVE